VLDGKGPTAAYDGYGSCPLTVERGKIVLAEFGYGGKLMPSFPTWLIDGTKATRLSWMLKADFAAVDLLERDAEGPRMARRTGVIAQYRGGSRPCCGAISRSSNGEPIRSRALTSDLMAAVIVTIMLIPQSLAYAMLAGLPPVVGLYASILPLIAYALFGTSRTLAVGPVAVISLMTASAAGAVAAPGSAQYMEAAITLAALSGVMLVALGCCGWGSLPTCFRTRSLPVSSLPAAC
jgi:hypothetical protein